MKRQSALTSRSRALALRTAKVGRGGKETSVTDAVGWCSMSPSGGGGTGLLEGAGNSGNEWLQKGTIRRPRLWSASGLPT